MSIADLSRFNIVYGPNATGKTNCIEGIYLLTNGVSFKKGITNPDLVGPSSDSASVSQMLESEKRRVEINCSISGSKKTFTINGKNRRASECPKVLPSVLFRPDDLLIIKGGAAGRRDLIDTIGVQLSDSYREVLKTFLKALTQRNALIKQDLVSGPLFESWTASLVKTGGALHMYRSALIRRLLPHIQDSYQSLSRSEELQVRYQPFCGEEFGDKNALYNWYEQALYERRTEELARKNTVVGPHHDDLELEVSGRPVKTFGSQGQQRTAILAVKLAHTALVKEYLGHYPVFLLDDVMSELDNTRRRAIFSLIDTGMQTVITTANLEYFTDGEKERAQLLSILELTGKTSRARCAGQTCEGVGTDES